MAKNYYTLVAGLREYTLGADQKNFDARAIIDDIREQLSGKDEGALELLYNYYDIENIVNMKAGRNQFSAIGNFTREQLEEEIKEPVRLPKYIGNVIRAYADPENADFEEIDREKAFEKSLFEAYYKELGRSRCKFLRSWGEFDRNLRNLSAAFTARRLGRTVAEALVGEGYVVDTISRSSAADFGLKGELEYIDQVVAAIAEEGNLLDKENKIDHIRWEMADELTTFDYFNINTILAYLVKVNIVHRWVSLDPKAGREMFEKLLASLSSGQIIEEAEIQYAK